MNSEIVARLESSFQTGDDGSVASQVRDVTERLEKLESLLKSYKTLDNKPGLDRGRDDQSPGENARPDFR